MSAPDLPPRVTFTFDSPECKLDREETERGRAIILAVMPGATFKATFREMIEEGKWPKVLRKRLPPRGRQ